MSMELVTQDIYALEEAFTSARVDMSMKFANEANFALQLLGQSDYLLKVASSNRQSLSDAVMNVASIGISLNPARKQAYLVPRKGAICLDISYRGLVDMATATGSILWAQANIVRQADIFELCGYDAPPVHKYRPFATDRGDVVGVYAVAKTHNGDYLTHPMTIADVYAIRDRSEAWRAWINKQKSCPWVTDEAEMTKKSCVKQASKYWPRSEPLDRAIHYLNTRGDEGIELAAPEPEAPRGKPAVSMPRAREDVTDVEPRTPVADRPATKGEATWVVRRLDSMGIDLAQACERAGIADLTPDVAGMTRAHFVALREVLQ